MSDVISQRRKQGHRRNVNRVKSAVNCWVFRKACRPGHPARTKNFEIGIGEKNMSTRFEILKNGKRVCISGINGDGVLSVGLTYVKHPGQELAHNLSINGLGLFDGSQDRHHHAGWLTPDVTVGDEITIRILSEGEFDNPYGMTAKPAKTLDDTDFGKLSYYIDAWDAVVAFDSAPLTSAHIHLRADELGPSLAQRNLFRELAARHAELWPEISAALVRCHPEIETIHELSTRIVPRIEINLQSDSDTVRLSYRIDGDPEYFAYYVTLRKWKISEVYMAR